MICHDGTIILLTTMLLITTACAPSPHDSAGRDARDDY